MTTPHEAPAVAMTKSHLNTAESVAQNASDFLAAMRAVDPVNGPEPTDIQFADDTREIASNIRSQVQGGMVLVDREKIEAEIEEMEGVSSGSMDSVEWMLDDIRRRMKGWLTPTPDTTETEK